MQGSCMLTGEQGEALEKDGQRERKIPPRGIFRRERDEGEGIDNQQMREIKKNKKAWRTCTCSFGDRGI